MRLDRRAFLAAIAASAAGRAGAATGDRDVVGEALRPWRPGGLDIHHIATGRGDSTLVIGPDGSSLMIDAGASSTVAPPTLAPLPDSGRRPGEWIARYALRRLADTGGRAIDAFLATHQHPDHIGDVDANAPLAPDGRYRLTGVSDVDALVPIRRLIDRGYPDYAVPVPSQAPFQRNYQAYVASRRARGLAVERFRPGALDQLRSGSAAPGYAIRNIAANGQVWTGEDDAVRTRFPSMAGLPPRDVPDENVWSAAIRISLGRFAYFAAGDLTSSTYDGALPWRDMESAAAEAAGPVSVAVAPHHGMFDATGPGAVRALDAQVWIIQAWHALHPSPSTLDRLLNGRSARVPRIFATAMADPTATASPWLTNRLASRQGHVIVRVATGGDRYSVVITDSRDERDRVTGVFGPFDCRK
ncbi:ComEC/Rec2 family competence protein [Sphingomonas sanxanigenens]|uniref:Metallo-beta-lactamase domain-containing protein n=1 Tax=Sphingomonas sanxanigenens DSM 19645 = NX02 TaxID=1123269 RepID=W0AHS4_9SPHN|nr:MBL fold metallo-hydrolase [Sphingomonas sanxanigenens]AHE55200.1 hypothetical protein NX02_17630 [Sphingomonas sanxanigenens DSM 19645 = NX02]